MLLLPLLCKLHPIFHLSILLQCPHTQSTTIYFPNILTLTTQVCNKITAAILKTTVHYFQAIRHFLVKLSISLIIVTINNNCLSSIQIIMKRVAMGKLLILVKIHLCQVYSIYSYNISVIIILMLVLDSMKLLKTIKIKEEKLLYYVPVKVVECI